MTPRTLSAPRFAGFALMALAAAAAWRAFAVSSSSVPRPSLTVSTVRGDADRAAEVRESPEALIDSIIQLNPFGEGQTMPVAGQEQRFGAMQGMAQPVSVTAPPRLSGIVGPPWSAVVSFEGGTMGVAVSVRDSVRGFRVMAIARDYVLLRRRDSTYRITLTTLRQ